MSVVEFVAPRGFGPPLHVHDDEDEVMILVDPGEVAQVCADHRIEVLGPPPAPLPA